MEREGFSASVQEVRSKMSRAVEAAEQLAELDQQQLDRLVEGIHRAALRRAKELGKLAWQETGFGNPADKERKNIFAAQRVYEAIRGETYIGPLGEDREKEIVELGVPLGVIAGLVPSTNPTSTVIYKAMIALKAGNAIVFSPHPAAAGCIGEAARVVAQGVEEAGGPKDAVQCLDHPTQEGTEALLRHPEVKLILATGGGAMVKLAYSSGHPAIGVGAGNGPAYLHPSCCVEAAIRHIFASKTFDNGTICASEQSIVVSRAMAAQVEAEVRRQGGWLLSGEEKEKLGQVLLRPNGTMNPAIVGRSAQGLCRLAGLGEPPVGTRVLLARENQVGERAPFSGEKLAPVLAYYVEEDEDACLRRCVEILRYEGAGHSVMIHGTDREAVLRFGAKVPASRVLVNTPGALGGIGETTGLFPALTLGCGAAGGSSSSDNIGPHHLSQRRRIAWGIRGAEENGETRGPERHVTAAEIARLVEEIMGRLR